MNLNETIRLIEFAKDNGDTIDDVLDLLKQIAGTDGDHEEQMAYLFTSTLLFCYNEIT